MEKIELFKDRLQAVLAKSLELSSLDEALSQAVQICADKIGYTDLLNPNNTAKPKLLSAVGLEPSLYAQLEAKCLDKDITCIKSGLRDYIGTFDLSIVKAEAGIADTGTCFIVASDEDLRLSTMLAEISVILLDRSKIVADKKEIAPLIKAELAKSEPSYLSYITGPSRTADIERVLTVGVHGPLELYVFIINDM